MEKKCIACGMPMTEARYHAGGNERKKYCIYCARPDGSMQSYEEKLDSLTEFIMEKYNLDKRNAVKKAKSIMSELPAWEKKKK